MKSIFKIMLFILLFISNELLCQTGQECWIKKPDLLTGRVYIYPAFYSNKIFAVGGGFYDTLTGAYPGHSNILEEYDLSSNLWQTKNNIPSGTGGYIVQMNDRIFVFGRNNNSVAYEYLQGSDTWQSINGTPRFLWTGLPVCEMISFQNKVYAFSFCQGTNPGNISVFDPSTSEWTTIGKMKSARSWFRLAVVKNKIYVIEGHLSDIPTEASLKMIEEYNPLTNEWISKKSLQFTRHEVAVSTFNDKIYIIGGHDMNGVKVNIVEEYDPENQESVFKQNLPYNVWGSSAITANNKIYVLGGVEGDEICSRNFYEYNPDLDNPTDVLSESKGKMIYKLYQNYPNPFNPSTKIKFRIPNVGTRHAVSLRIYDILGREITTLFNEEKPAGEYEVEFSANGGNALYLPSGIYFYRLSVGSSGQAGSFSDIKKMSLIK